jgi:DnaK suppressor protein
MNSERTSALRQSLEVERRKIAEGKEAIIVSPCADANEFVSFYEHASITLIVMERARQRLRHLEQSIAALESLPHNCCVDCGEKIPQRRLEAKPDTVRCITCQKEREDEQRRLPSAVLPICHSFFTELSSERHNIVTIGRHSGSTSDKHSYPSWVTGNNRRNP